MNWFDWILVAFFALAIFGVVLKDAPTKFDMLTMLIFVLLIIGTVTVRT